MTDLYRKKNSNDFWNTLYIHISIYCPYIGSSGGCHSVTYQVIVQSFQGFSTQGLLPNMKMRIFNSNCSATSNFRPSFSSIPLFTRHTKFNVSTISHLSPLTLLATLSGILISFIHCSGSRYLNHNSSTMLLQLKVFRHPVSTRQRRTHQKSSMDDSQSKKVQIFLQERT